MDDPDWDRLVRQLRAGECTPFLGAGACHGTLPTGPELARHWANHYKYPFADTDNLPRVSQFATSLIRDPVDHKKEVVEFLLAHGRPAPGIAFEPHRILAELPIPVYITTNYDDFMVDALRRVGKRPSALICRWYEDGMGSRARDEVDVDPHADTPVVFHFHGSAAEPESLVLTEEDYLEFLIMLAAGHGADDRRLIPTGILPAFARQPLLFVGYSLQDWTFRVLFQGLQRTISRGQKRRHISVQLPEPIDPGHQDRAIEYLTRSFEAWNITVYWGTAESFFRELSGRLGLP